MVDDVVGTVRLGLASGRAVVLLRKVVLGGRTAMIVRATAMVRATAIVRATAMVRAAAASVGITCRQYKAQRQRCGQRSDRARLAHW